MLGTNPYPFTRLMDRVVDYAKTTGETVIVQSGHTPVKDNAVSASDFIPHDKVIQLIKEADVVVVQGGFGSLQDCISHGARTVAVPRLREMGESVDDQTEIVNALAEEGLVVPLYDVSGLAEAIEQASKIEKKPGGQFELPQHISKTINKMLGR